MLTLIKLFDISIVASNCFGFVRRSIIDLSFFPPLTFNDSISEGESEKNAVSDPEISPEKNNKIININNETKVSTVKPKKNCSLIILDSIKKESESMSSKMTNYINQN